MVILTDEHLVQLIPQIHGSVGRWVVERAGGGHVRVSHLVLDGELEVARSQSRHFSHPLRSRRHRSGR